MLARALARPVAGDRGPLPAAKRAPVALWHLPTFLQGGLGAAHRRRLGRAKSAPPSPTAPQRVPMPRSVSVSSAFSDYNDLPSAAWSARCADMARNGVYAELPEVQAAAHLFNARIRVFMPDGRRGYTVGFEANPHAPGATLDLVLDHQHFRFVRGGAGRNTFRKGSAVDRRVQDVSRDGNCLFHCIAQGLAGAPSSHSAVRAGTAFILRRLENAPLEGSEGAIPLGIFAEAH